MPRTLSVFPGQVEVEYSPEHISSSQRSWLDCRRYWALSSIMRLRPRDTRQESQLEFGTVLHEVLGTWYSMETKARSLGSLLRLLETTVSEKSWPTWMYEVLGEKLREAISHFHKKFGDDGLLPLGIETQLDATLSGSKRKYLGFADWYYKDGTTIVVEDLKTSPTSIDPSRYTLFNPKADDYLWAIKQMYPANTDIVFSYLFLTPDRAWRIRVPRHNVDNSGVELAQIAKEQISLPIIPNYGYHCGRCRYQSLCAAFLTGRPVRDIISADFVSGLETEE